MFLDHISAPYIPRPLIVTLDEALERISKMLVQVKADFATGKAWLLAWFRTHGVDINAPVPEDDR